MTQIREGQKLRRKDQPQICILVVKVYGEYAKCIGDDGHIHAFSKKALDKHYEVAE